MNMKNVYKLNNAKYSTHRIIAKEVGENSLVLDVGCNDGYMAVGTSRSNTFYGLDYSKESIEKTSKFYKGAVVYDLNHVTELPWDTKFDVIIMADVLEHLISPERTLDFFVRNYLKKTGTVIVSLPNIANWKIRLTLLFGHFNYTDSGILDKTHLHLYTHKTSKSLLKTADLEIRKCYGGSSVFGPIIKYLPFTRKILSSSLIYICKHTSK
jgi:2-polyprenyl-3-methyl-5-hydroxy-6-metoxy-1,4-benzoquinol methylase